MKACDTNLAIAVEKQEPSKQKTWAFLRDIILNLGIDGMSSEETEYDGSFGFARGYGKKALPWRREIEDELEVIEAAATERPDNVSRKGRHGLQRDNDKFTASDRRPPNGLPRALYNWDWINNPRLNNGAFVIPARHDLEWRKVKKAA